MIELIYVVYVLFFGPDQYIIDEFIKELEDDGLLLTVEEEVYDFLGFEVKTDKKSGELTLTQGGLTKKVLKTVEMLDSNNNITPTATISLVTDTDGPPFD